MPTSPNGMLKLVISLLPTTVLAWVPPRFVSSQVPSCGFWHGRMQKVIAATAAAATRHGGGNVVVIGANTGPGAGGADPIFDWLNSTKAGKLLDKIVYVEPLPVIFRVLQHNLQHAEHAVALNLGIANTSGTLDIYCLGLDQDVSATATGQAPTLRISQEATRLGVPGFATMTCSLNRERLFSTTDFARSGRWGGLHAMRNLTAYEALITRHPVQVITFAQLMQQHVRGRVLYMQIDVEGRDDDVVLQALRTIPAAELPVAITFEISVIAVYESRVRQVMNALSSRGYRLCWGSKNLVAQRDDA